ncbi:hypothetical protein D3C80_426580 [compost metagenome]
MCGLRHHQETGAWKGGSEQVELNPERRIAHRLGKNREHHFIDVVPTRGNIERRRHFAAMIADRCGSAAQSRISRKEMLVAKDRNRSFVRQCRTDTVGSDTRLGPDGRRPKAKIVKGPVIPRRAAPFQRNTVSVGQQQAATRPADGRKELVHFLARLDDQALRGLPRLAKFAVRQAFGCAFLLGRKMVHNHAAPPRSNDR